MREEQIFAKTLEELSALAKSRKYAFGGTGYRGL